LKKKSYSWLKPVFPSNTVINNWGKSDAQPVPTAIYLLEGMKRTFLQFLWSIDIPENLVTG